MYIRQSPIVNKAVVQAVKAMACWAISLFLAPAQQIEDYKCSTGFLRQFAWSLLLTYLALTTFENENVFEDTKRLSFSVQVDKSQTA